MLLFLDAWVQICMFCFHTKSKRHHCVLFCFGSSPIWIQNIQLNLSFKLCCPLLAEGVQKFLKWHWTQRERVERWWGEGPVLRSPPLSMEQYTENLSILLLPSLPPIRLEIRNSTCELTGPLTQRSLTAQATSVCTGSSCWVITESANPASQTSLLDSKIKKPTTVQAVSPLKCLHILYSCCRHHTTTTHHYQSFYIYYWVVIRLFDWSLELTGYRPQKLKPM